MGKAKPCRFCENPVAPNARRCPVCGGKKPYPTDPRSAAIGCLVTVVVAVAFLTWGMMTKEGRDARRAPSEAQVQLRDAPPSATKPHVANPFAKAELLFDTARAQRGSRLFSKITASYPELDEFYRHVDRRGLDRGFAAFISVPIDSWNELDPEQRLDLGHFMSRESSFNGWAIYVGAIDDGDVLLDSTGLSSRDWDHRRDPDARYEALADHREDTEKRIALHRAMAEGDPGPVTGTTAWLLYTEARELVRERLKSPRGAVFSDRASVSVRRLYDGAIEVLGWVEAENSFGASIRTHWTATIRAAGIGDWSLISLQTNP